MLIFKIFKIRKSIKEIEESPSQFASSEVRDTLWGLILAPIIIIIIGVIIFFILGYTNLFGFHFGFFKFLFWLSLIVGLIIFSLSRTIINALGKKTMIHTKSILKEK